MIKNLITDNPLQKDIIQQRVTSNLDVAHCLKCGWWIVDRKIKECEECGKELMVWTVPENERKEL
jgi:hypothetical protein